MTKCLIIVMTLYLCAVRMGWAVETENLPPVLVQVEQKVQKVLDAMDTDLGAAADELGVRGLAGADARKVLGTLCREHPYAASCATVGPDGRILIAEPKPAREFEGTDVSHRQQWLRLRRTKKPVLSEPFVAAGGFVAVDLQHPVLNGEGKLLGSVGMLIRPALFLEKIIAPEVRGVPVDFWVMQKSGFIVFDPDSEERGRNLFRDPLYAPFPQLQKMGRRMAEAEKGGGTYEFHATGTDRPVTKRAHWTTAGLHGTPWRIVMTKVVKGEADDAKRRFSDLELLAARHALRRMAEDPEFKRIARQGDRELIVERFKAFYEAHPSTYTIQWATSEGVVRFGYPPENSLTGYDFRKRKAAGARRFLRALRDARECSFEMALIEGGVGEFFLCPVRVDDEVAGLLYTIRKKRGKK